MANQEDFPSVRREEKQNTQTESIIKGANSFISESARSVFESGANNCVGEGCSNVTIFNSSGCTVLAGVVGATIINSSGVTCFNNGETWINNSLTDKRIVTTTNNVQSILASFNIPSGHAKIKAEIFGVKQDGTGGYGGEMFAAFRSSGGSLVQVGVNSNSFSDGAIVSVAPAFTVSGNVVQIVVTPDATIVQWLINYTIQKI